MRKQPCEHVLPRTPKNQARNTEVPTTKRDVKAQRRWARGDARGGTASAAGGAGRARSKRRERERRRAPRLGRSRRANRANTGRDRDVQQESGGRGAPGNDEPTRGGVCVKRPRRRPRRSERTVCVAGRYCRVTRVQRHNTSSRRHRAHRTSHGCRSGRRRRAGSLGRRAASEPRDAASLARKTTRSSRCWCVHWFFLAVHLLMSLKPTSYLHSLSLSGTPTGKPQGHV